MGIDGVKKVTSWFTSGKLAGKVRKIISIKNGAVTFVRTFSYDDKARILRKIDARGVLLEYSYDDTGKQTRNRQLLTQGKQSTVNQ